MTPPDGYPRWLRIGFRCACYSLVFCFLASFVPFWPTTEFPKPGQTRIGRNTCGMPGRNPDGTRTRFEDLYCRDSMWFFWGEPVNVAFDDRMTGTGYLQENTLIMAALGAGSFLFLAFLLLVLIGSFQSHQTTWKYSWDYKSDYMVRTEL